VDNNYLLKIESLKKSFYKGTTDQVEALNDVKFDIREHDFITIVGSNGAGKSTLLNMIAGVYMPDSGRIYLKEKDITYYPEYHRAKYLGRVYQDPKMGTATHMTIEENLSMALLRGRRRGFRLGVNKKIKELFYERLSQLELGLEKRLNAMVATLSGGQRQALTLIMATISNPMLMLFDEHVSSLDPRTAELILNITDIIVNREKITTLMVTHNMEHALKFGNRLVMMHKGRIILDLDKEKKSNLTISKLIHLFERAAGEHFVDDEALLSDA